MSSTGINNSIFNLLSSSQGSTSSTGSGKTTSGDFATTLAQQMADFRMTSLTSLFGSNESTSALDWLTTNQSGQSGSNDLMSMLGMASGSNGMQGLSASGRNLSLFDPESGYQMMSTINNLEVSYKAQFAELSAMEDGVAGMEKAGENLEAVDGSMDNAAIKGKVQEFADQYNAWIARFGNSAADGSVLAGSWTAETALNELEQSVASVFNGAGNGFSGVRDLGLSIDEKTHQLTVDTAKLDAALASNKNAVVNTLDQFSANFAKSADLLNQANNVIPHQLDNLDRVIDYIADNRTDLQQEFGTGDAAKPTDAVSQALAAYNRMLGKA
jgi:flagellar capping protein FliD